MKKKLLVLLIGVIPTLMPSLASAIEIEIDAGEIAILGDYLRGDLPLIPTSPPYVPTLPCLPTGLGVNC